MCCSGPAPRSGSLRLRSCSHTRVHSCGSTAQLIVETLQLWLGTAGSTFWESSVSSQFSINRRSPMVSNLAATAVGLTGLVVPGIAAVQNGLYKDISGLAGGKRVMLGNFALACLTDRKRPLGVIRWIMKSPFKGQVSDCSRHSSTGDPILPSSKAVAHSPRPRPTSANGGAGEDVNTIVSAANSSSRSQVHALPRSPHQQNHSSNNH